MTMAELLQNMCNFPGFLMKVMQVILYGLFFFADFRMLFKLLLDEHQQEAYEQQQAGDPYGTKSKECDEAAAKPGTEGEQEDDTEIMGSLIQGFFVMGLAICTQGFHAAADVTDTHGAGKGKAVDLAERLYLHGAGKGNHGIGNQIKPFR